MSELRNIFRCCYSSHICNHVSIKCYLNKKLEILLLIVLLLSLVKQDYLLFVVGTKDCTYNLSEIKTKFRIKFGYLYVQIMYP